MAFVKIPESTIHVKLVELTDNCIDKIADAVVRKLADRKTENSSEKPNNCEDEFFREPTAEERKAVADYIDSISVLTGVNVFDLMDEQTDCPWK